MLRAASIPKINSIRSAILTQIATDGQAVYTALELRGENQKNGGRL